MTKAFLYQYSLRRFGFVVTCDERVTSAKHGYL